MSSYIVNRGVHVPACRSLTDHVQAACAEGHGDHLSLDDFIRLIREDWSEELLIADSGDEAVIEYWRQSEADHAARFLA